MAKYEKKKKDLAASSIAATLKKHPTREAYVHRMRSMGHPEKAIAKGIKKYVSDYEFNKRGHSGFDSRKRFGNSAMKGHGVNSPAMMEERKKFNK